MVGDVREMSVIETALSPVLTGFTVPWGRQSCPQKMATQSGQGWGSLEGYGSPEEAPDCW